MNKILEFLFDNTFRSYMTGVIIGVLCGFISGVQIEMHLQQEKIHSEVKIHCYDKYNLGYDSYCKIEMKK